MSASGSLKGNLTFSVRASGQQVRFQRKQKDIITSARTVQRSAYAVCVDSWNSLNLSEKKTYNDLAQKSGFTGYNLYMKACLTGGAPSFGQAYYGIPQYGYFNYGLI